MKLDKLYQFGEKSFCHALAHSFSIPFYYYFTFIPKPLSLLFDSYIHLWADNIIENVFSYFDLKICNIKESQHDDKNFYEFVEHLHFEILNEGFQRIGFNNPASFIASQFVSEFFKFNYKEEESQNIVNNDFNHHVDF